MFLNILFNIFAMALSIITLAAIATSENMEDNAKIISAWALGMLTTALIVMSVLK